MVRNVVLKVAVYLDEAVNNRFDYLLEKGVLTLPENTKEYNGAGAVGKQEGIGGKVNDNAKR